MAAPPARAISNRVVLMGLIAVALVAMAALQRMRSGAPADMVELLNREPINLSPFFDETGKEVRIESFRGRVVVLNLWAPWCVPCLKEMPSLDRLAGRLPEKDFAVVAVTKDAIAASPSRSTFDRMGLQRLKLYLDPKGELAPKIGSRGFPTTLILGTDGAPLAYQEGPADWDGDAMIAKLDALAARSRRAE